jgi:hypothetical protein
LNFPKASEDSEGIVRLPLGRHHFAAGHKISMQIREIDRPIGKKGLKFERKPYIHSQSLKDFLKIQ